VVERHRLPKIRRVAALAFIAKSAVVHVVGSVAADTGERKLCELFAGMAGTAFHFGVGAH